MAPHDFGGQLHVLVVLSLWIHPNLEYEVGWAQNMSGNLAEEINSLPQSGSEPTFLGCPTRGLVVIMNELYRVDRRDHNIKRCLTEIRHQAVWL